MCSRGVWQLKALQIRYSETGHSSRGVRFYFRHLLNKWKEKNPQVAVTTLHSQYEEPEMTCSFANDTTYTVALKMLKPRQIEVLMDLYRNSESGNEYLKHGGPKVWTDRRSIQGLWQPSLEGQVKALKWFHRKPLPPRMPKYSSTSTKLSLQAVRGEGRWGSEREYPKGWDQMHLKEIFEHPFDSFVKNAFQEANKTQNASV
eukprot:GDKI01026703.1.p1 GENE.GDKI01026703.1~~GDKI01026703.1.p1  ORF type:complete len:202 (+),score=34.28 GDKI01026703.1:25-630(+)